MNTVIPSYFIHIKLHLKHSLSSDTFKIMITTTTEKTSTIQNNANTSEMHKTESWPSYNENSQVKTKMLLKERDFCTARLVV